MASETKFLDIIINNTTCTSKRTWKYVVVTDYLSCINE